MAKKAAKKTTKKAAKSKAKKGERDPGELMSHLMLASEKKLGPGIHYKDISEHSQHHVGLPLPALALEYLFGSNVLYLGALYGIAGPSQSFKWAFAQELGKLVVKAGGINTVTETEGGKIAAAILQQIYGKLSNRVSMRLEYSVEAAQSYLSFCLDWAKKQFPNRDHLVGLILDSLNGSSGEERHKAIQKAGHAERGFPIEAMLWSKWFQDQAPKLLRWPFVMIFVNHEKKDINDPRIKRHPGGDAQDFYSTVYMHVRRVKTNEGADTVVNHLTLQTMKHSFSLPKRKINMAFVLDKKTGKMHFDWGHATADLLTDPKKIGPAVKDIVEVTTSSNAMSALTRTFSCKQLGLTQVTGAEMGAAIHKDKKIMRELRKLLYVRMNTVWGGVMPVGDEPVDEEPGELDNGDPAVNGDAHGYSPSAKDLEDLEA